MTGRIHFDSFSGAAADLKPGQRTARHVLAALARDPRVSTFDLGEAAWLVRCINDLKHQKLIVADKSEPYPWCRFELTEVGKASLEQAKEQQR